MPQALRTVLSAPSQAKIAACDATRSPRRRRDRRDHARPVIGSGKPCLRSPQIDCLRIGDFFEEDVFERGLRNVDEGVGSLPAPVVLTFVGQRADLQSLQAVTNLTNPPSPAASRGARDVRSRCPSMHRFRGCAVERMAFGGPARRSVFDDDAANPKRAQSSAAVAPTGTRANDQDVGFFWYHRANASRFGSVRRQHLRSRERRGLVSPALRWARPQPPPELRHVPAYGFIFAVERQVVAREELNAMPVRVPYVDENAQSPAKKWRCGPNSTAAPKPASASRSHRSIRW